MATLLGVALGCLVALPCAVSPPRDFSYRILAITLMGIGPCGGVFGYILWIGGDLERHERFQRMVSRVAIIMLLGLLVAFPSAWWQIARSMGPHVVVIIMGAICGLAMFAVGAGWGIIHLVHQIASSSRHFTKLPADFRNQGVWDRDLDAG